MSLADTCSQIQLILSDVDGVLTDGGLIFDAEGNEFKKFHIRDGMGIRLWQRTGHRFGLITGRRSPIVQRRAKELDIPIVRQGNDDKLGQTKEVAAELGMELSSICYVGDDLPDLPAICAVGFGVAVADAAEEVRTAARYITRVRGGQGAVREAIEVILRHSGRWEEAIKQQC